MVHQLVPKVRGLKMNPFLKFYPSATTDPAEDTSVNEKKADIKNFSNAISIPDDLDLLDKKEMTTIQEKTNLFKTITSQVNPDTPIPPTHIPLKNQSKWILSTKIKIHIIKRKIQIVPL